MDRVEFGLRLKNFRKQKNLTQAEFAEIICIGEKSLSAIESGRTYPQFNSVISLSKALGKSIDFLIADDYDENKDVYICEIESKIRTLSIRDMKHILKYIELFIETKAEFEKSITEEKDDL